MRRFKLMSRGGKGKFGNMGKSLKKFKRMQKKMNKLEGRTKRLRHKPTIGIIH